jgi:response regulator RpfG family c-di-GMP phosphodiesterase
MGGVIMLSIMLIIENKGESNVLELAFSQYNVNAISGKADHSAYINALNNLPDVIIIEFPDKYSDQLNYIQKINALSRKKKEVFVISYGNSMVQDEMNALTKSGVKFHLERPLKFSQIVDHLGKQFNFSLKGN